MKTYLFPYPLTQPISGVIAAGGAVANTRLQVATAMLVISALLGCQAEQTASWEKEVHPVSGAVTIGGKPASDVFVVFHPIDQPADGELRIAPRARTGDDGTFQLTTFSTQDGAPVGKYRVAFSWLGPLGDKSEDEYENMRERLNRKLTTPATSGIEYQVSAGENPPAQFAL